MNEITKDLLERISDFKGSFDGAYNLRVDGACAGRQSSENIRIDSKTDNPGLEIHIRPGTKGERVSIPACVTHGDVNDLVYNDFFVGAGADVTIVAGCGVHTETGEPARHNGIHRFFLEEGAHVLYLEKHIGTGKGEGLRSIDPVTEATLEKDAVLWYARHKATAEKALELIDASLKGLRRGDPLDAVCTLAESALAEMGMLDGRGVTEDIVSEIFARFCVGK